MPVGIQRLNARHQPPTDRIIFIKPLPGPDATVAEEFLSRVAAICHPIMKQHSLSVMTLEEYEPNPEFIGRNFNAGEVIQLVLRTRSGQWLGFRSVVMVMMHELAHCKQMNHSREFWKVRNVYAADMRGLWARSYTGEGVWGQGRSVGSGAFENRPIHEGSLPENLCGGTYRRRRQGRKRKRQEGDGGEKLTYAEKQQRRIAKKFGVNGQTLGEDEILRIGLENGRRVPGKPRVASSKRARELRAQAALLRLRQENSHKESGQSKLLVETEVKAKQEPNLESETESESEESAGEAVTSTEHYDQVLQDSHGHELVKVCPEEDLDDIQVKSEWQELQELNSIPLARDSGPSKEAITRAPEEQIKANTKHLDKYTSKTNRRSLSKEDKNERGFKLPSQSAATHVQATSVCSACPVCSLSNSSDALTCVACSNVLLPSKAPGHWKCDNGPCHESKFINSGDAGRCGICGQRRKL